MQVRYQTALLPVLSPSTRALREYTQRALGCQIFFCFFSFLVKSDWQILSTAGMICSVMDNMYLAIIAILFLLAIFDLVVGVSNDAANFLNSAIGSRAARRSFIVMAAAIGVIIGASLSSGMMEVARSGIFKPEMFTFHEIMLLFLAVMLTDVILLDLFNTFGMPTSTTVSLVFELLGGAVAMALYKIYMVEGLSHMSVINYINDKKVLEIILAIFSSVGIAFGIGCILMWFSRVIFGYRYTNAYKFIGPIWSAIALTAITYFAVFKGLSKSTLFDKATIAMLNENIVLYTVYAWCAWLVICAILQYIIRVNVLRFIVITGTAALALAFAGNDLVNFIGVFMAAKASFGLASDVAAQGGDYVNMSMGSLSKHVQTDMIYLIGAGLIMVAALFFSKKARTVSDTEVKLARTSLGVERFGSTMLSRMLVRNTMKTIKVLKKITPTPIQKFVVERFRPLDPSEETGAAFDLIRASVNLTAASLIICWATSQKLPLSTTYVTFMVAMGTSLADRAWGRESAVYRITGVLTVIGGWFFTGIAAFTAAFITATVLVYGGIWGIILMVALVIFILVKTSLFHRKGTAREVRIIDLSDSDTLKQIGEDSANTLGRILGIHHATVTALLEENHDELKRLRKKARNLDKLVALRKQDEILPSLHNLPTPLVERGQILYRITESLQAISESLNTIVSGAYTHIDNHHRGLNSSQADDLLAMSQKVSGIFPGMREALESGKTENIEEVLNQAGDLSDEFADCITRHLTTGNQDIGSMRSGILYLNLLNETRSMVRKSFSLIKEQKEFYRSKI